MTILFLDVNAALRGERTLALKQQTGWEVNAVGSLAEARAWLAKAKELDLLITEAVIDATTTGFELRDAALARFPEARGCFSACCKTALSHWHSGWVTVPPRDVR